ncbi:dynein regulatory complex subunit 4-like, partial [Plectropomus leopardus]|uniref:dynein regulatory complex subunit 4-like n=1 Tax=Plectropomus leopardus TaxID=160734 RepID=UPI001C4BA311
MPPKTKGKKGAKGKSSAVVDGLSTEEMSKDQLEEHIVRLREELDREREERSYFQLERDKIQAFWENCKRTVEETKARIRNRHREREEAEERHRVEITEYKQKMRHVLFEHDNTAFEQKMDGLASTSLIQNQHAQAELGLRRDARGLQANFRDKKLENENLIKELNLKHQVELIELINDHDRRVRDMELKYHKQMQSMTEAANKTLEVEVNDFDNRVKRRAETLTEEHRKALRGAQEYFSGIKSKMLEDQKLLEVRDKTIT